MKTKTAKKLTGRKILVSPVSYDLTLIVPPDMEKPSLADKDKTVVLLSVRISRTDVVTLEYYPPQYPSKVKYRNTPAGTLWLYRRKRDKIASTYCLRQLFETEDVEVSIVFERRGLFVRSYRKGIPSPFNSQRIGSTWRYITVLNFPNLPSYAPQIFR